MGVAMATGGRPPKDVEGGLLALIARAAANPESIPVGNVAIAESIGVSEATLRRRIKGSNRVASLVDQLREHAQAHDLKQIRSGTVRRKDPKGKAPQSEGNLAREALDDADIERKAAHQLALARRAAEMFRARKRYHENLSDLPRAVFDLDRAVNTMLSALHELRPLTHEYISRAGGVTAAGMPVRDQVDLLDE
jgi:hypothetical protein